jgi:hypothetical protein
MLSVTEAQSQCCFSVVRKSESQMEMAEQQRVWLGRAALQGMGIIDHCTGGYDWFLHCEIHRILRKMKQIAIYFGSKVHFYKITDYCTYIYCLLYVYLLFTIRISIVYYTHIYCLLYAYLLFTVRLSIHLFCVWIDQLPPSQTVTDPKTKEMYSVPMTPHEARTIGCSYDMSILYDFGHWILKPPEGYVPPLRTGPTKLSDRYYVP